MSVAFDHSRLEFAPARVDVEPRANGEMILRSPSALGAYPRCIGEHLERWAQQAPERVFVAERSAVGDWRRVTYGEARHTVRALAAGLLEQGLSSTRPIAILSDNSVNQALLTLAAMHVGVPVAPISPAYSLVSQDFAKLKAIVALLEPGMVYVEHPEKFASALRAVDWNDARLVIGKGGANVILPCDSEGITPQNQGIFCRAHIVFRACAHRGEPQTIVELLRRGIRDTDLKGRPCATYGTRLIHGLGHHLPGAAPLPPSWSHCE